jgi:membrane protease YdiL (CAAX protease family)
MQAIAPKPKPAPKPNPPAAVNAAQLSLRAVTTLEVVSVIASIFITTWALIPLQPPQRWLIAVPAILAIALMINSHRVRGETWRELGFTTANFGRALRLLWLPTLLACATLAAIGYWASSFHRTSHFYSNLFFLPLWALIQQYALQGFVYRRVRSILVVADKPSRQRLAIVVTAVIFALAHAPNVTLMLLTLLGALGWSWVYERAPNLYALAISHALISLLLMTALPAWLLDSMSVGYKHFLYQKF